MIPLHGPRPAAAASGRDRGRRRRRLGIAASVLAGAGTLLAADAIATVAWQEPVSAVLAARSQAALRERQQEVTARFWRSAPRVVEDQPVEAQMDQMASSLRGGLESGDPVGRLRIPRVGGSWVVVAGAGAHQLQAGPGLVAASTLPGRRATTMISGRRTTFGAPFRELDEVSPGDRLELALPYGVFAYEVERSEATSAPVLATAAGAPRLVLTAPASRLGGTQRRVVTARQVAATPRGPVA